MQDYRRSVKSWSFSRPVEDRRIIATYTDNAHQALGKIYRGMELYGLTKGQFSMINLIIAILDQTGPADVSLATWTAAQREIDESERLLKSGLIRSLRFLVDRSFPARQPSYCARLRHHFGDDVIRVTSTHAKFVLARNADWNIVLRTSMNLNKNDRLENFEVSDDPAMADFLQAVVDEIFTTQQPGEAFSASYSDLYDQFQKFGLETKIIDYNATDHLGANLDDPEKPGYSRFP
jgi:hypothetical protein